MILGDADVQNWEPSTMIYYRGQSITPVSLDKSYCQSRVCGSGLCGRILHIKLLKGGHGFFTQHCWAFFMLRKETDGAGVGF